MTGDALIEAIAGVDVVSLDVFDTALLRCVDEPVTVFSLVERAHAEGRREPRFAFADERRRAEGAARAHVLRTTGRGDVTLDEIYAQLAPPLGSELDALRALELAMERLVCVTNPFIHALYREALRRGRRVAFVSDMYLPAAFIGSLLDAAGYGERACLLVSCEEAGESKGSGALYARLADRLGTSTTRILHVGDNQQSDVVAAQRAGLTAIWYECCAERARRDTWRHPDAELAAAVYRGLVQGRLHADRSASPDPWYSLGYAVAGPAWWHYAGRGDAIVSALGASPTVLALEALSRASGDARGGALGAGITDFTADFERLRASLPWLRLRAGAAIAPLLRMQRTPTDAERKMLTELLPRCTTTVGLW
jgi:FMN phosphatase YigB (HAD superfamily)